MFHKKPVVHSWSDFAPKSAPEGKKLRPQDIIDKRVMFTEFKIGLSKAKFQNEKSDANGGGEDEQKKECLTLQFIMDGKTHIIFTSSAVLIRQCREQADNFPFYATIRKINNYYVFS
jgi:hypothetical protein